jgi:hypothetical protein
MRLSAAESVAIMPTLWEYCRDIVEGNVFNPVAKDAFAELLESGKAIAFIEAVDGEIKGIGIVRPYPYAEKWVAEVIYGKAENSQIWQAGLEEIEAWARQHKFHSVEVNGKVGWERLLRKKSYSKVLVVMRKQLNYAE